jgi:hypothetical protein
LKKPRHYHAKLVRSVVNQEKGGPEAGFTPSAITAMRTGIRFGYKDGKKNET